MNRLTAYSPSITLACLLVLAACCREPSNEVHGIWKGKTKIDQDITITLKPDSTIQIETETEGVRQIRKGTYQIIDRRLRISLTSVETFTGGSVRREEKADQDEAVFTITSSNEMVLRRGTQAMVLERVSGPR